MDTDETITVAGQTITARDHPRGEFGVYRHYEIADRRFVSLEDAKAFAVAAGPQLVPQSAPQPVTKSKSTK